jgi:hypothetical protein
MRVVFQAGYYPDRAHDRKRRTEDYWNSYFYVWGVKVGRHRRNFYILTPQRVNITAHNFSRVRKTFGKWAAGQVPGFSKEEKPILVPVPSKDALPGKGKYRSLQMTTEAFAGTDYADCVLDGLRWKKEAQKAHEGGTRKRVDLLPLLQADASVKGKKVVLVDELFSTGGSLLAAKDALEAAGAEVLGAITCGKTIYDFKTPAFGDGEIELTRELADWPGSVATLL